MVTARIHRFGVGTGVTLFSNIRTIWTQMLVSGEQDLFDRVFCIVFCDLARRKHAKNTFEASARHISSKSGETDLASQMPVQG